MATITFKNDDEDKDKNISINSIPENNDFPPEKDNKNFFIVAAIVAGIIILLLACWMIFFSNSGNDSVKLIKAESSPIKVAPDANNKDVNIPHQDKTIYNEIDGQKAVNNEQKVLPAPEEPLPMPDKEDQTSDTALTDEEKTELMDSVELEEYEKNIAKTGHKTGKDSAVLSKNKEVVNEQASVIAAGDKNTNNQTKPKQQRIDKLTKKIKSNKKTEESAKNETKIKHHKNKGKDKTNIAIENTRVPSESSMQSGGVISKIKVQVASLNSRELAEKQWKMLTRHHPDLFQNIPHNIIKIDLGSKGIKYRLQVGNFKNATQAKQFINKLKEHNIGSFITR